MKNKRNLFILLGVLSLILLVLCFIPQNEELSGLDSITFVKVKVISDTEDLNEYKNL